MRLEPVPQMLKIPGLEEREKSPTIDVISSVLSIYPNHQTASSPALPIAPLGQPCFCFGAVKIP